MFSTRSLSCATALKSAVWGVAAKIASCYAAVGQMFQCWNVGTTAGEEDWI